MFGRDGLRKKTILLDLPIVRPWRMGSPVNNVLQRNQSKLSKVMLTITF